MWYDELKGVQMNKTNARDIAEWVEGEYHVLDTGGQSSVVVIAKTARGDTLIREGDWVVIDVDERFRIVRLRELDLREVRRKAETQKDRNILEVSTRKYDPKSK